MEEALSAFDQAVARRPRYWRNHHGRGLLLLRMGRHDEAEQAFDEMKLGQLGRAQQHIAEALAVAPDDGDVLYAHAVVTALAGQAREALPILQRAVEQGVGLYLVERDDDLSDVRALQEYSAWLQRQGTKQP